MISFPFVVGIMQYRRMKFNKILKELDSEEKARAWVWLAKFDGKIFFCPKCQNEQFYQHKKIPKLENAKTAILSIGVAIYPTEGSDIDTLLKKADIALYREKEIHHNK